MLKKNGLDHRLAFHISSLFIRSPIPVFKNDLMFPCCKKNCPIHADPMNEQKDNQQEETKFTAGD